MVAVFSSRWLQLTLQADGIVGLAVGAVHLLAASLLADWLALPRPLLLGTGAFLLGWGVWLRRLGRAPRVARAAVWAVIIGNMLWVVGALVLLLGGSLVTNVWGSAYLVLHVVLVLAFAELEWFGLRRSPATTGAQWAQA